MIGCYANMVNGNINQSIRRVIEKGGDCTMVCAQSPIRPSSASREFKRRDKDLIDHEVIVHAPFSINLATNNDSLGDFSIDILVAEVAHTEKLDSKYLVIHPGSALKQDRKVAMSSVAKRLLKLLERTKESNVMILLETMAGKGSELGCTLEEIEYILSKCGWNDRIGVCLDTCHLHDGGYELNRGLIDYMNDLGILDRVHCVHVNGSKNSRGSKKDRHVGIFSPENHIDKEVIYDFVQYFHQRDIACVSEKEIEDITTDLEYLRDKTGFDESKVE